MGVMPSQALIALKEEVAKATATIKPQIEGLKDFARLDLKEETKTKVADATTDFERRLDLLNKATEALNNLENDAYPVVADRQVLADVYKDLAENVSTIQAAFAKFRAEEEAASASITPGDPRPRSD